MRKFSQLNESKSNSLLTKLGTSEDEIKDICSDLTDEGYKIDIEVTYIGLDGHIYRNDKETTRFYPSIEIELYRDTANRDEYGQGETKEEFNDVRKWNGGVYYEGNIGILKTVYEICHRFESTFTSTDTQVYFSMRSINEVRIRITFPESKSDLPISFSKVEEFISNNFDIDENYEVSDLFTHGDGINKYGEIDLKHHEHIWTLVKRNKFDNKDDLRESFKEYCNQIYNFANNNSDTKLKIEFGEKIEWNSTYDIICKISYDKLVLIKISGTFEITWEQNVVVAKGIFKDRTERFSLYKMDFQVSFNINRTQD